MVNLYVPQHIHPLFVNKSSNTSSIAYCIGFFFPFLTNNHKANCHENEI